MFAHEKTWKKLPIFNHIKYVNPQNMIYMIENHMWIYIYNFDITFMYITVITTFVHI